MTRNTSLLVLFVVALAAGAWWFRPAATSQVAGEESCADECRADARPARELAASEEPADTAARAAPDRPAEPSPSPSPPPPRPARPVVVPTADGRALRAEADRLLAEGSILPGLEALRAATEADPTAKNHGDLGDLLERLTAIDEALVHLRQAAELDPGNADRWIALANAYYRAVNPGEAWKAEKRAKEAEPGLVLGRDKSGRRVRQGDSEPRKP